MPHVELPFFGTLDTRSVEEYYESEFEHNARMVSVDLNFEKNSIEEECLITVKKFLQNIPVWIDKNNLYIRQNIDDEDDGTVREYASYLIDVLKAEELGQLVNIDAGADEQILQIAEKLQLVRIGLYPDGDGQFAIFDYTIGRDLVDYLVVINTDENGILEYMTMES
jgi:hypothetical protein